MIFVSDNQVQVLQILFKTSDMNLDLDMDDLMITLTIGIYCTSKFPCWLKLTQLFENFLLIEKMKEEGEDGVPTIYRFPDEGVAAISTRELIIAPEYGP